MKLTLKDTSLSKMIFQVTIHLGMVSMVSRICIYKFRRSEPRILKKKKKNPTYTTAFQPITE